MNERQFDVIKRKIELENELIKLKKMKMDKDGFISYIFKKYSFTEVEYLTRAYLMPIKEIEEEIDNYDKSHPKLDELKFVEDLAERYNVSEGTIIQRIQDVRRMRMVENMALKGKKIKKRKK